MGCAMAGGSGIIWLGMRPDGYKLGRYRDPKEPDQIFDVEVAIPELAAHLLAPVTINGAATRQCPGG
jgi:hypothetical protein